MLADAGKTMKVHLYYWMKKCDQSPTKLRENILNIVSHYQVSVEHGSCAVVTCMWMCTCTLLQNQHSDCHEESPCRQPGHTSSKIPLTSLEAYKKTLQSTPIYKIILPSKKYQSDSGLPNHRIWCPHSAETHTGWSPSTINFLLSAFILAQRSSKWEWTLHVWIG